VPPACSVSVSPPTREFNEKGGDARFTVKTSAGDCPWSAASSASWAVITRGATGTGDGEVRVEVADNPATAPRTAEIRIVDARATITQSGRKPETVSLAGRLGDLGGSCPTLTFTVDKRTVRTRGQTTFSGGSCSQLVDRMKVEVQGEVQADGVVLATSVKLDADNEEENDDAGWAGSGAP
jgi:hypothetical protein